MLLHHFEQSLDLRVAPFAGIMMICKKGQKKPDKTDPSKEGKEEEVKTENRPVKEKNYKELRKKSAKRKFR